MKAHILAIKNEIIKDSIIRMNMKEKNDFTGTILEPIVKKIAEYKAMPNKALANQISCIYSYKNPQMNG
jgi:hypothetical protein